MGPLKPEQVEANWKKAFAELEERFLGLLKTKDAKITELQKQVDELQKHVIKLEDSIDDTDAVSRLDQVVVSGADLPVVRENEDTKNIITDLFRSKLRFQCSGGEIVNATRLGPKPKSQKPDRRSILVTTSNRGTKQSILSACRSEKPSFFVNENLTAKRRTIMYVLRKIKKDHPDRVKGLSTYDGRVFAYIPPPHSSGSSATPTVSASTRAASASSASSAPNATRDQRILVNTYHGLVRFCNDVVGRPLENFLLQWPH